MSGWVIDKVVGEFDYGHNVWAQELDPELSCNSTCKCKWRHGHRGKVVAHLAADDLERASSSMVIDFNDMKIMTRFIDSTLDHKYLVDVEDPANFDTFSHFFVDGVFRDDVLVKKEEGHYIIDPKQYDHLPEILRIKYESYVLLDFCPTSENLSKWMFEVMSLKMASTGVRVHKIEWYETPKSRATYYG
jgi:6-pyruvoyltetrahydropterin/6-carboxytetrahydropterin synthase